MSISEQQLETWSHIGAQTQSASTYQAVRDVLEHPQAPYANRGYEIYLQGSYGNDTNVRGVESDVDIVICLTDANISDTSNLNPAEKSAYEANRTYATYGISEFKRDVFAWLHSNFGNGVRSGRKAIAIPGNGTRRDADVLACIRHRRYSSYQSPQQNRNELGIAFYTTDNDLIINFPKQHKANATSKHQATHSRFKPSVRVMKNIRNAMIADGFLTSGIAPSYFIEGLLWNVPSQQFATSFQQTVENQFTWLERCNPNDLTCANNLHWLIRDGNQVCWDISGYSEFVTSLRRYWSSGHR